MFRPAKGSSVGQVDISVCVCVRAESTIDRTAASSPFLVPAKVAENTEKNRLSHIGSSSQPISLPLDRHAPTEFATAAVFWSPESLLIPAASTTRERERERGGDAIDPPFPHCQVFSLPLGCVGHRRLSFFGDSAENDSRPRPTRKRDNFSLFPFAKRRRIFPFAKSLCWLRFPHHRRPKWPSA